VARRRARQGALLQRRRLSHQLARVRRLWRGGRGRRARACGARRGGDQARRARARPGYARAADVRRGVSDAMRQLLRELSRGLRVYCRLIQR
jgi:hypothetical protein